MEKMYFMQNTAMTNWATSEFGKANFNDTRLTNRLIKLADHFGNIPEIPINQACGTWVETKAAYRFFKNEKVEVLILQIQKKGVKHIKQFFQFKIQAIFAIQIMIKLLVYG